MVPNLKITTSSKSNGKSSIVRKVAVKDDQKVVVTSTTKDGSS